VLARQDQIRHPPESTPNRRLGPPRSVPDGAYLRSRRCCGIDRCAELVAAQQVFNLVTRKTEPIMRMDKLTIKAQEALQAAHELAASRAHQELTPEHVLAALLDQPDGIAGAILRKLGVDPAIVRQSVAEALDAQPQVSGAASDIYVGRRLKELMEQATKQS